MQEFCEDCDNRTKLVTREPELRSNDSLPAAFERATGERIYDGLCNGFRVRCNSSAALSGTVHILGQLSKEQ